MVSSSGTKRSALLKRMFTVLTGEHITSARYVELLRDYLNGVDDLVDADAVKLVNEIGVIYLSDGLVYEEIVVVS